jgi:type IV pilus secretin PilQ/predicted competence protein
VTGAETKMTMSRKARAAHRLIAGCAIAAAVGGLRLAAAPAENVRLVGVSSQTAGKTAAILIEATQPVAYSVSRPDPLTVLVDLRNVTVGNADARIAKTGPLAGVTLEQATALDGEALARVRVALTAPVVLTAHSERNVIRVELEPGKTEDGGGKTNSTAAAVLPANAAATDAPVATRLERVRASQTKTATTVTLGGNGRLTPSSLAESDDQPRRLVLDFPNVTPAASPRTSVDSAYVKAVRVALNSRDPLVTRVVMDIAPAATYHVERTGTDGRDLAVVFEGPRAGGALLIAPGMSGAAAKDEDEKYTMEQALANAASLVPRDVPRDPISALVAPPTSRTASARPSGAQAVAQHAQAAPGRATQAPSSGAGQATQNPPATPQPPAQNPPPPNPPAGQSTFASEVPGSGPRQYVGAPVNFDFEDADLRAVLRLFSQFSGLNMIIDPAVQGRVNVLLNDVPWDQALEQILRSNKLGYTVDGNIMRIAPLAVLADEQAQTQKLNEAKALAGELQVRTFPLSYAKAEALAPLLTRSALSARGQIQVDTRTNTLIAMDLPDRLQTAQALLTTLDKPQPQVEVEARVVQTSRDFARAIGIQWGFNGRANSAIGNTTGLAFPNNGSIGGRVSGTQGPIDPRGGTSNDNAATAVNFPAAAASSAVGLALGSINGAFNLDVALTALENTGKGRVLSTPRLTTQNNQTAEVAQGVQIPIQTVANNTVAVSFKDATLKLSVTPQITASNTVIMNISIENATPDFGNEVNGIPPINTQRALTTVQVSDGATTVIGGIFVSNEQTTNDRTPVLYRVPLLKWLFQRNTLNDSSRELLIFVTPRILRG